MPVLKKNGMYYGMAMYVRPLTIHLSGPKHLNDWRKFRETS